MAKQRIEMAASPVWMDTAQLAEYIGIKISTIYQYVRELRIPYHKVPGSQLLRFNRTEIDLWMATGRVETAQEALDRQYLEERANNGTHQKKEGQGP